MKNVVSLDAFKKDKTSLVRQTNTIDDEPKPFPTSKPTDERRYIISLTSGDSLEVEGYLGLGNTFLAVGDEEGKVRFAAATGSWTFVTDITDKGTRLKDYVDTPQEPT